MRNRLSISVAVLLVLLSANNMAAQEPEYKPLTYGMLLPDFNGLTPEAASLGTYGRYAANGYTGSADISFPLCEARSGSVSLPVSLYYDTSGIKVAQEATRVGLGWNLSYGGCISHIVCGADDFTSYPSTTDKEFRDSIYCIAKGYHTAGIPQTDVVDWDMGLGLSSLSDALKMSDRLYHRSLLMENLTAKNHIPDVFEASFCGHSLTFTIDKASQQVTVLNDNARKYKVEYSQKQIWPSEFTITDDHGVRYIFRAFDETDRLDSYWLTEIRGLAKDDIIAITYQQHTRRTPYTFYQSFGKETAVDGGAPASLNEFLGLHSQSFPQSNSGSINQIYPSVIESQREKIFFNLTDRDDTEGGKAISSIRVVSKNGNAETHNIRFGYGYFEEQDRGESKSTDITGTSLAYTPKRLRLESLNADDKLYRFSYNESTPLPYRTSLSQDYWGYYNGTDNNTSFCCSPEYAITGNAVKRAASIGTANRRASATFGLCGILTRITYPTGGYTLFEYEPHRFNDPGGYYYPTAEQPPSTSSKLSISATAAQTTRPETVSFTLDKATDVTVSVNLFCASPSSSMVSAHIKCMHGNNFSEDFSTSPTNSGLSKKSTYHLEAGVYIFWIGVPYIPSDYSTSASLSVSFPREVTLSEADKRTGGHSWGGGLRVKAISSYDTNGSLLEETAYEYQDGKLLVPTVQKESRALSFCIGAEHSERRACFDFVGSEPSYPYVMSMGLPNVGYSSIVERRLDKDGCSNGHTVRKYENQSYTLAADCFYYLPYGLNGKLLSESVFSESGDTLLHTSHTYGNIRYEQVLFPRCEPMFLSPIFYGFARYRLTLFPRANEWSYLKQTEVTRYVHGRPASSTTTTYDYDEANYQPYSIKTACGTGLPQTRKQLMYPDSRTSVGAEKLIRAHCIAEVTGEDNYSCLGAWKLSSGYRNHYHLLGDTTPVLDSCQTRAANGVLQTDMVVGRRDSHGNILEYTDKNGRPTALIWSYNYQLPVLEIVGITYDRATALCGLLANVGRMTTLTEAELRSIHACFAGKAGIHATAFLYNPWNKVSLIISPNGDTLRYEYDSYGRLCRSSDSEGHSLSKYQYHYAE